MLKTWIPQNFSLLALAQMKKCGQGLCVANVALADSCWLLLLPCLALNAMICQWTPTIVFQGVAPTLVFSSLLFEQSSSVFIIFSSATKKVLELSNLWLQVDTANNGLQLSQPLLAYLIPREELKKAYYKVPNKRTYSKLKILQMTSKITSNAIP